MKKKWWVLVGAVLLIGLGYAGYRLWLRPPAGEDAALAADLLLEEVAVVERGTLRVTADAGGSLVPSEEVALAFHTGGQVREVLVDVGNVVQVGDVLARLDDADARQAVAEAELNVKQAEIDLALAEVEAETGLAQANLDAAQADYNRAVSQVAHTDDQLTSARVGLSQALAVLEDAQENYNAAWDPARDWELGAKWLSDRLESDRETTEYNLQKAKDELEVAQANYNLAVVDVDRSAVQNAKAQVVNAQLSLEKVPTQVEQAELALAQMKLKLASAQRALDETVLLAPIDGTVTDLSIKAGEMASSGQAVAVLSDLETLIVDIDLDEIDVARVSLGQKAIVMLDAFDDMELAGKVTAIAPTADIESGVVLYPVEITLDLGGTAGDLPVRAGMTADVEVITSSAEDVLYIPLKAVRSVNGGSFVLRQLAEGEEPSRAGMQQGPGGERPQAASGTLPQDPQAAQRTAMFQQIMDAGFVPVPVELGITTEIYVEVTSGLEEGDVVSIASTSTLSGQDEGFGAPPGMMFGGRR